MCMQDYISTIESIQLMLNDAVDEFIELNQDSFDTVTDSDLLELHRSLTQLQKFALDNLVYPLQDTCIDIGEVLVDRHTEMR